MHLCSGHRNGVTCCFSTPSIGMLAWPHQDTLLMLNPSIVFDFFNQTVACWSLFIAHNVCVWMMLPFSQVILAELCRLQPSWTEQSWFVSWREGGTLCSRGFFSVNSNDGAELSSPFLLSALIRVFLCPLEDWAEHSHSENTPPPLSPVVAAAPAAWRRREQAFITWTKICEYI